MALTASELQWVNEAAGCEVILMVLFHDTFLNELIQVLCATVARLYKTSDNGAWYYPNIWGAVALVPEAPSTFIRIFDVNGGAILYEQELYENFEYSIAKPFFHVFESDDCVHGLSFADVSDAVTFGNNVRQILGLEPLSPPQQSNGSGGSSPISSSPLQTSPATRHPSPKPLPSIPPKSPSPQVRRSSFSDSSPPPAASYVAPQPTAAPTPVVISSPSPVAVATKPTVLAKADSARTIEAKKKPAAATTSSTDAN